MQRSSHARKYNHLNPRTASFAEPAVDAGAGRRDALASQTGEDGRGSSLAKHEGMEHQMSPPPRLERRTSRSRLSGETLGYLTWRGHEEEKQWGTL